MRFVFVAALLALLSGCATRPAEALSAKPKNILFFVASGASFNVLTAARIHAVGEDGDLAIDTLPESAFVKIYSNNAQGGDGDAGMTAYLTGVKVNNGVGPRAPTLADLATRRGMSAGAATVSGAAQAIGELSKNPRGFFLVVRDQAIGVALQNTNARRALDAYVLFDNALKAAIAQMRVIDPGLDNTLIIATSDHERTMLLNGYSRRTGKTTETQAGVLGLIHREGDGLVRRDLDGAPMAIIGFGTGPHRVQGKRSAALTDAIVSADDYQQEAVVRATAGNGGGDVFLGAVGAGANAFHGTIDNTQVFAIIKAAAGL